MSYTYDNIKIGEKLKDIRNKRGLTLENVAKQLYVRRQTISEYEKGHTIPAQTLAALCNIYKCDINYLLGENECVTKDIQFINDYTGLSEKTVEVLHEMNVAIKQFSKLNHDYRLFDRITISVYNDLIINGALWELIVDIFNMKSAESNDKYLGFSTKELQEAITAKKFQEVITKFTDRAINSLGSNEIDINQSDLKGEDKNGNNN